MRECNGMLWKYIIVAFLTLSIIFAISVPSFSAPADREILVSTAISLKDAFDEIGDIYQKRTGIRARFNLGASGLLQKQIEAGAPADVFASAGEKQMDALQNEGLIIEETRRDMVRNILVLIVPYDSRLGLHSFAELARPEVTKLAIGNPKTVPAGQYARQALQYFKLWSSLQPRIVLAENVRQVLEYVVRGEVEAGIVYGSDVSMGHGKAIVAATAPADSHDPILYPIAVVKGTEHRAAAQRFIDLILSGRGQAVLAKYGFIPLANR
jgi:molybdate transport system substrate-binding protein